MLLAPGRGAAVHKIVSAALASAVYGFFYGLWPIAWIIVAAVFLYKLSVKTGQFDVIHQLHPVGHARPAPAAHPWWVFALARFWKARLAGAPSPSPPRCWWAWASSRCTPPACA